MATTKKFSIENPTDEMIENLEASAPGEDGFHVTKLSARDFGDPARRFAKPAAARRRTEESARSIEADAGHSAMSDSTFFVELLENRHDRKNFDCGEPTLNDYLARFARQNMKVGSSRTYVAVATGIESHLRVFHFERGRRRARGLLRRCSQRLAAFGARRSFGAIRRRPRLSRSTIGGALCSMPCFRKRCKPAAIVGITVVEVWALNQAARRFYSAPK